VRRVGYLGPPGTFSEEAVRASPLADGAELVPFGSIHETIAAVEARVADLVLVPIENSLEGGVNATLDALAGDERDVAIVGEAVLPIRNCLIAARELAAPEVGVVLSHPQPLAQCERFLRAELPGAEVRPAPSTADAVRTVAATAEPWAALGPRGAAARYDCVVLRDGVDDDPGNATRFVWLAAPGTPPLAAAGERGWKTSVVFAGAGDAQPGWLVRCLSEFAFRGVNLTKIESRPRRARLGHYLFHVDMEGRGDEGPVADAVAALHAHCEEVRTLGTYPAA
jgi:prephenate dehydratase